MTETSSFALPSNIVSKADVARLVNEVERADNDLTAASVRSGVDGDSGNDQGVQMSEQLSAFLEKNNLNLDDSHERSELIRKLRAFKDDVPVIHMTFSATADGESLGELADWVRSSVHPNVVIEHGLQPALVAGVHLRTPNKIHDLSLRAAFRNQHDSLVGKLGELRGNS